LTAHIHVVQLEKARAETDEAMAKLRHAEEELGDVKSKYSDAEEEIRRKYSRLLITDWVQAALQTC
jgi:predicted  nucleic acid-binding Zn-ribbon protein